MSTIMTETHQIQPQLTSLNQRGFLTINSQPRVNGVASEDPHVGWGGPHGYAFNHVVLRSSGTVCFAMNGAPPKGPHVGWGGSPLVYPLSPLAL